MIRFLTFLVVVGALASGVALAVRHRVEARHRAVALVVDRTQTAALATAHGQGFRQALAALKESGITGVAVTEDLLGDLQARGDVTLVARRTPRGVRYRLKTEDPELAERLSVAVPRVVGSATEQDPEGDAVVIPGPGGGEIFLPGRPDELKTVPTGLSARLVKEIQAAGLTPVARLNNYPGLSPAAVNALCYEVADLGIRQVIFAGDEVLGFLKMTEATEKAFREAGLEFGAVEFGKQRGDDRLLRALPDRTVRVHSISPAEMGRLSVPDAVERYVRAGDERNIRLCYVRLPALASETGWDDVLHYVRAIRGGLTQAHLAARDSRPFESPWPSAGMRAGVAALIGAGTAAATLLVVVSLFPLSRRQRITLAVLLLVALPSLAASGLGLGEQLVALAAACTYPCLGVLWRRHGWLHPHNQPLKAASIDFVLISVVTLLGAAAVGGLLSTLPYLVKARAFAGIKLATVVPLAVVGLALALDWRAALGREQWVAETRRRIGAWMAEPVRFWQAAAAGLGLILLLVLVARSGNDPGVGISDLELRFRSLLDRLVGVRPRTKEFLFGHPMLWIGLWLAARWGWRPWMSVLMVLGAIGQTGMLNSFCHLHTPVLLSAWRTWNGLWTGTLITALSGVVVILVVRLLGRKHQARAVANG